MFVSKLLEMWPLYFPEIACIMLFHSNFDIFEYSIEQNVTECLHIARKKNVLSNIAGAAWESIRSHGPVLSEHELAWSLFSLVPRHFIYRLIMRKLGQMKASIHRACQIQNGCFIATKLRTSDYKKLPVHLLCTTFIYVSVSLDPKWLFYYSKKAFFKLLHKLNMLMYLCLW